MSITGNPLGNRTDWDRFPVETITARTFLKRALIHAELLRAALQRAAGGILEIGVGSGAQSALLSHRARTVTVDKEQRIIHAALPNLHRFGREVAVLAADGFALPFADRSFGVAISQGLMEHFSDDGIALLLGEHLRVCSSVVFSVPSENYPRQDLGDERLMRPAKWQAIVEAAIDPRRFNVRARYYRLDLESLKYGLLARRGLGSFSVLVTIDRK